jgi:AcrR family transcriptional regulator
VYVKIGDTARRRDGETTAMSSNRLTRPTRSTAQAAEPPAPRRQARGERRIAQLLEAAGEVFADVGYDNATTNAIAAKAGVSPGTLYQFFPNKQAIAEALAATYAARNKAASDRALDPATTMNLEFGELVDHITDPLLAFHREAPAFEALFTGSVVSKDLAEGIHQLHAELQARLERVFSARRPDLSEAAIRGYAQVAIQIFKGLLPLTLAGGPEQRKQGARELKTVIARYLNPVFGEVHEPTAEAVLARRPSAAAARAGAGVASAAAAGSSSQPAESGKTRAKARLSVHAKAQTKGAR